MIFIGICIRCDVFPVNRSTGLCGPVIRGFTTPVMLVACDHAPVSRYGGGMRTSENGGGVESFNMSKKISVRLCKSCIEVIKHLRRVLVRRMSLRSIKIHNNHLQRATGPNSERNVSAPGIRTRLRLLAGIRIIQMTFPLYNVPPSRR